MRALLVAPSVERAAALAVAFDDVAAVTPSDLAPTLAADRDFQCVAIAGVPVRGGRLASVITSTLQWCPPDVQVLVELDSGLHEFAAHAEALRGLAVIDLVEIVGISCLRFSRASDPSHVPDVVAALGLAALPGSGAPSVRPGTSERVAALEADLAALRLRLEAADAELVIARAEQAAAQGDLRRVEQHPLGRVAIRAARPGGVPGAPVWVRVGRAAILVAVAALAIAAAAVGIALGTEVTATEAMVAWLIGLGVLEFAWLWRVLHRSRAAAAKLAATVAAEGSAARAREEEVVRALTELTLRLARIEHNVAVSTATSVDTAKAAVEIRKRVGG